MTSYIYQGGKTGRSSTNRIPIEGEMYGAWKVISYYGMLNDKKSAYLCECTLCGMKSIVRTDKLRSGKSTKCRTCANILTNLHHL